MIILNVKSKTMKRDQIIRTIKEVLSERGIKKAYLFGSFARREQYHDIDIAIETSESKDYEVMGLRELTKFEEIIGRKIDRKSVV